MEQLLITVVSIATFLNALSTIMAFISKAKKPVDKKLQQVLEPINNKLNNINDRIDKLDKNQCKNYLTEFLEDLKKGVEKTDIEKQRATEVYDHYRNDLHLNTYIHDEWEIYMK